MPPAPPLIHRLPQRQPDVAARRLDAAGASTEKHRVEGNVAAGGLDLESLDAGGDDADIAAGAVRAEATGRALDAHVAAGGLQHEVPTGPDDTVIAGHRVKRDLTGDALDVNVARGGMDLAPAAHRPRHLDGNVGPADVAKDATPLARLG